MDIVFDKGAPQDIGLAYEGPGHVSIKTCLEREQAAYLNGQEAYAQERGQQKATLLQSYAKLLKRLEQEHAQIEETLSEQLPELLMALAQRVWGEASLAPEALKTKIQELLSPLGDVNRKLTLHLSPHDKALFESEKLQEHYPRLHLEEDKSLASGDLILETPLGLIDARVKTQLKTAVESLEH